MAKRKEKEYAKVPPADRPMETTAVRRSPDGGGTLEQQRARDAWETCHDYGKDHVNLAKGLPALMMNSGLMQTMAFLHERGDKPSQAHCERVANDLRRWLHGRFDELPSDFEGFMEALFEASPTVYRDATTEAFAWLSWLRRMAPARLGEE